MAVKTKAQLEVELADLGKKSDALERRNTDLNAVIADLQERITEKPQKPPWFGLALLGVLILVLIVIAGAAQRADRSFDKSTCHQFAAYSQHTTRFVDYNAFDWDCLVQTSGATWVSKDGLGAVEVTLPLKKN
jgi:mannosyltransferase OCH1-like enzyme